MLDLESVTSPEKKLITAKRLYLDLLGVLGEKLPLKDNFPKTINFPISYCGDVVMNLEFCTSDGREREQLIAIENGLIVPKKTITGDNHEIKDDDFHRDRQRFFGKKALFHYHLHPIEDDLDLHQQEICNTFSHGDIGLILGSPRMSYIWGVLGSHSGTFLFQTAETKQIILSSALRSTYHYLNTLRQILKIFRNFQKDHKLKHLSNQDRVQALITSEFLPIHGGNYGLDEFVFYTYRDTDINSLKHQGYFPLTRSDLLSEAT